jgi:hypothetical protein
MWIKNALITTLGPNRYDDRRCPLRVKSRHQRMSGRCPLSANDDQRHRKKRSIRSPRWRPEAAVVLRPHQSYFVPISGMI